MSIVDESGAGPGCGGRSPSPSPQPSGWTRLPEALARLSRWGSAWPTQATTGCAELVVGAGWLGVSGSPATWLGRPCPTATTDTAAAATSRTTSVRVQSTPTFLRWSNPRQGIRELPEVQGAQRLWSSSHTPAPAWITEARQVHSAPGRTIPQDRPRPAKGQLRPGASWLVRWNGERAGNSIPAAGGAAGMGWDLAGSG